MEGQEQSPRLLHQVMGLSSALSVFDLKRVGALIRASGRSRRAGRVSFSAPDAPSVGRLACGHSCWRSAKLRQSRRREAIHYS
jgi:hypothetical protein